MNATLGRAGFAACLLLLFVWSLPRTIALRYALLVGAAALLAGAMARGDWRRLLGDCRGVLGVLLALTVWLVLQALLLSPESDWALGELRGQWLPALLALLVGLALGHRDGRPGGGRAATGVVLVFALQAAIAVGHAVWYWVKHDRLWNINVPLTGGKLEMSVVLNLLLVFVAADLVLRASGRRPMLRLPPAAVAGIVAVALLCTTLADARNGLLGIVFLALAGSALAIAGRRRRGGGRKTAVAALAGLAVLAGGAALHYQSDPRWGTVADTAAIAWDIDRHRTWTDTATVPWPTLPDGTEVEKSAYVRIANIHVGLRLIGEYPLGWGYGRNAFGHALRQSLPVPTGHAHSGWIDLGVGGGLPALALWATALALLAIRGWRAYARRRDGAGLALCLLVGVFALRMLLDSVNKDHMLQMFMFLAGLLLALAAAGDREAP